MRRLLKQGRVTVAGEVVRDPGLHLPADAVPYVDDEAFPPLWPVLVYHKPAGVVSSTEDRLGRRTLAEVVEERWRGQYHPVGRLDAETRGLLLFSHDGTLTQRLLHPRRAVEREYVAEIEGEADAALTARLAAGVQTAEGVFTARVVESEGARIRLVVTEGKHRMVRRMLANAGHPVLDLVRVRFGAIRLGDLAKDTLRPPTEGELAWLAEISAGRPAEPG